MFGCVPEREGAACVFDAGAQTGESALTRGLTNPYAVVDNLQPGGVQSHGGVGGVRVPHNIGNGLAQRPTEQGRVHACDVRGGCRIGQARLYSGGFQGALGCQNLTFKVGNAQTGDGGMHLSEGLAGELGDLPHLFLRGGGVGFYEFCGQLSFEVHDRE